MTSRDQIADYLDQWLALTGRESQAIQKADWKDLAEAQTAKAALRQPLRQTFDDWSRQNPIGEAEDAFRGAINRLLALETQNAESLALRKQAALERKRQIEQASRNLRMVRDSYARSPATAWQSYS